jgi:acetyl-CoA carboxylase biotin carboxyl carrier protein
MVDLKTLKQLLKLMADNDLVELDLEGEGEKVRLKRRGGTPEVQYLTAGHAPSFAPAVAGGHNSSSAPAAAGSAAPAADAGLAIKSPMVGTFYLASSPDAAPFVAVGDRVGAETVVCIIEAMKVFNEIKAEVAGVIEKVLIENGQPVEFGQPLFLVKPN